MKPEQTLHTFTMAEATATLVHKLVDSHMHALKNWTASAVERGELERAQELVKELRQHEKLFAAFNMPAKREIAAHTGKPLVTQHDVHTR